MDKTERERRWRLILGGEEADGIDIALSEEDQRLDRCLSQLYETSDDRRGGLGRSSIKISRWLGDIRHFFPSAVVKVMQQDALSRLHLQEMLFEPELLESIEADVGLVANILALKDVIPEKAKQTARTVVTKVVEELIRKLTLPTEEAITGSLNRAIRNNRPKYNEIDWSKTIKANLKHYQVDYKTIIPERRIGFGRKRSSLKDIILCVDQSGSMATSVIYASIFAAVMASLPAVSCKLICFDTSVIDLSEEIQKDPIDVLFGIQLGGGTDINRALAYSQQLIQRPEDTVFVLISDLYEGGKEKEMMKRSYDIINSGVNMITLLALSDEGTPGYNHSVASYYADIGIPCFGCTPDIFPNLMAQALLKKDIGQWAAQNDIVLARAEH